MAISKNFFTHKLSGHIGRQLVFKQYGEKTVVSMYPDMSRRKLTAKQELVNETMADANYHARGTIADTALKNAALLRLNVTSNRLYTALVKEFFANAKEKLREEMEKLDKVPPRSKKKK